MKDLFLTNATNMSFEAFHFFLIHLDDHSSDMCIITDDKKEYLRFLRMSFLKQDKSTSYDVYYIENNDLLLKGSEEVFAVTSLYKYVVIRSKNINCKLFFKAELGCRKPIELEKINFSYSYENCLDNRDFV